MIVPFPEYLDFVFCKTDFLGHLKNRYSLPKYRRLQHGYSVANYTYMHGC